MTTYLTTSYDLALQWFTQCLQFTVVEDTVLSPIKRWVVVQAPDGGMRLLLAVATTPLQQATVGKQAGDRVAFFLHVPAFWPYYHHLVAQGVTMTEQPRQEAWGTVVVFEDLNGNRWDLIGKS